MLGLLLYDTILNKKNEIPIHPIEASYTHPKRLKVNCLVFMNYYFLYKVYLPIYIQIKKKFYYHLAPI